MLKRKEKDMSKLINKHFGMIISVEPTEKSKNDGWLWRKDYKGFIGIIDVYESQRLSCGHHFIIAYDDARYVKTSVTRKCVFVN